MDKMEKKRWTEVMDRLIERVLKSEMEQIDGKRSFQIRTVLAAAQVFGVEGTRAYINKWVGFNHRKNGRELKGDELVAQLWRQVQVNLVKEIDSIGKIDYPGDDVLQAGREIAHILGFELEEIYREVGAAEKKNSESSVNSAAKRKVRKKYE